MLSKPRTIIHSKPHPHDNIGLELMGGNAVGIFVKAIGLRGLLTDAKGLRVGDEILEVSNVLTNQIRLSDILDWMLSLVSQMYH